MFHSAHIVDYYIEKIHTCNSKDYTHWFNLLAEAHAENFAEFDGRWYSMSN